MASTKRSILITGCTEGGAGHALAVQFAAQGLRVFATARSIASLSTLAKAGIEVFPLDVTSGDSIALLKSKIEQATGGKLDMLFNNAGRMYEHPAIESDTKEVRDMFETNVFGLFEMVKAFMPLLLKAVGDSKHPPTIINTSSVVSRIPYLFTAEYNASKAAVSSYSDTLRIELAPLGVKVVTLFMGIVSTRITSPDKVRFGPNSIYIDAEDGVKKRSREHAAHGMAPNEFARKVIEEVLLKKPSLTQGEYIWQGTNAFTVWLLNAIGWRKIFDQNMEAGVSFGQKVKRAVFIRSHQS